jgi:hypothetical protein
MDGSLTHVGILDLADLAAPDEGGDLQSEKD